MGLSKPVLSGILRLGIKLPTPIQRATIPIALTGKDVVAMARTGGVFLSLSSRCRKWQDGGVHHSAHRKAEGAEEFLWGAWYRAVAHA